MQQKIVARTLNTVTVNRENNQRRQYCCEFVVHSRVWEFLDLRNTGKIQIYPHENSQQNCLWRFRSTKMGRLSSEIVGADSVEVGGSFYIDSLGNWLFEVQSEDLLRQSDTQWNIFSAGPPPSSLPNKHKLPYKLSVFPISIYPPPPSHGASYKSSMNESISESLAVQGGFTLVSCSSCNLSLRFLELGCELDRCSNFHRATVMESEIKTTRGCEPLWVGSIQ